MKTVKQQEKYHLDCIKALKKTQPWSLGSELEKLAAERGDHPAIVYYDRVISYAEFNRQANRYAALFSGQGFKKGDVVALMMTGRPEYLFAVAGLSKLGIIIALLTPEVRGEVLASSINIAEARAVILGHEYLDLFQGISERIRMRKPARKLVECESQCLELPAGFENLDGELARASEENPAATKEVNSDDTLVYLYSTGSSGNRKAIPLLHKRFLAVGHKAGAFCHMNYDSIQYMTLPLHFNSGFNICFGGMVATGSTMVLRKRFSVHEFWDVIHRHKINYFVAVGEMCRYIFNQVARKDDRDNTLETVICNGMWGGLIDPFKQRFGLKHVIEIYGSTEGVGSLINYQEIKDMCGNLTLAGIRQGEVVRCNFDTGELLKDDNGYLIKCTPGHTGVLICEINELNVFTGYLNEPEATEAKMIRNAFKEGDQYYITNDLMELHEGDNVSFVDRLGDSYRWKGKTVSTHQVSDALLKFFGPIDDVTVYGVKVPGMEGRAGMAAMTYIEGEKMDWKRFIQYVNSRMPEHARPLFLRIVQDSEEVNLLDQLKNKYKKEGISPLTIKDPMFFLDPVKESYVPYTMETYNAILENKIRF